MSNTTLVTQFRQERNPGEAEAVALAIEEQAELLAGWVSSHHSHFRGSHGAG